MNGILCASCLAYIEAALLKTLGVMSAAVNLAMETAQVTLQAGDDEGSVLKTVIKAGYLATLVKVPSLGAEHTVKMV